MHNRNVPAIGPRYWFAISVASVLGANTGDFLAHNLHLGLVRGLLPLALVMTLVLLFEHRARGPAEIYYWMAIVTLRTAATNLADFMTHDLRLGYAVVVGMLATLLCALIAGQLRRNLNRDARETGVPRTDALYWVTMLTAGTLGTALGDAIADELGLGVTLASGLLIGMTGVMLAVRALRPSAGAISYWATIVAIRTAGTTVGDLSSDTIGLAASTIATFIVLVAILAAWRTREPLQRA